MNENNILYPQSIVGIMGNSFSDTGLVAAAHKMGFQVAYFSSNEDSQAMKMADYKYIANISDQATLQSFAEKSDVVTYNSEIIDPSVVRFISRFTNVPQRDQLLDMVQDHLIERSFFDSLNINTVPYATIVNLEDIYQAINSIGYPAILKPIQASLNDGKELLIRSATDIVDASSLLDTGTYILESYIEHNVDYAIIVTKGTESNQIFPTIEEIYQDGKLITSFTADDLDGMYNDEMIRIANGVLEYLDYVGSFEVSFFMSENGSIYVKKVTPKLSNAAFLFEYACNTNQFEEHLKAIANLPLSTIQPGFSVVQQLIRQKDYERIATQWLIKGDWHFTFNFGFDKQSSDPVGYILIPTDSVKKTLERLDSTLLWSNVDYKSKYETKNVD